MRNYHEEFTRELKNRNYARNTIRTYSSHIKHFLIFSRESTYEPEKRISVFLEQEKSSLEQRRLAWSSIKLFYEIVLKKECPYKLDRIRNRKRLPDILSKEEILDILKQITNDKHRLIISFLYGSGLRVSEVVNLKIKDFDLTNLSVKIRNTKGHKDRFTLLSEKSVDNIMKIIGNRDGNEYIFLTLYKKKYTRANASKSPALYQDRHYPIQL